MDRDRDYDADFSGGTRWYDYVFSIPLLIVTYPLRVVVRTCCRLGWHEWHWYRQTGGRKKKICVRCDVHAHKEG